MYQDKLGCYRVGDLKFHSKLDAIELHTKTGIHPHWDFNEAVFSSYDWTVEPTENILELYKQRAQQLRDQYDYIALFWSGGADSDTVLKSFLDNDIKIDEIVSFGNYEGSNKKDDYFNSELFYRILPATEKLKNQYPWLKFRVIDLSEMTMEFFKSQGAKFDWIYNFNMLWSPNTISRENIGYKIPDWKKIIDGGKKFCLLWGVDKPRVFHEDEKFFMRFNDLHNNCVTVKSAAGQNPYVDELFFWTPDFPKISIKQGHLIKNYLNNHLLTSPFISNEKSDLAYKQYKGKKYWLNRHGVHTIVYPTWDIHTYDSGKNSSTIFSSRDTWFFGLSENEISKSIWKMGIEKIFHTIPDYWKNSNTDVSQGLKASWSKNYYLE